MDEAANWNAGKGASNSHSTIPLGNYASDPQVDREGGSEEGREYVVNLPQCVLWLSYWILKNQEKGFLGQNFFLGQKGLHKF